MEFVLNLFLLVLGFVFLIKGADLFVDGSSSLAKLMKIPSVIIGLTIVSIGTSLPEASVSITASLSGSYDLSIANVIGSNIFNLLCVTGAAAIICPFAVSSAIMKRDFPISIGITLLLVFMLRDNILSSIEAEVLLLLFVGYIALLISSAFKNRNNHNEKYKALSPVRSIFYILIGVVAIILGGKFTVDSATFFAKALGMSEMLIGLTVVAVGTSLPELVTSIVAAKKGESEIALGNVIGSNIFNILFILGMSGTVHSLTCDSAAFIDTAVLIGISLLMFVVCITERKATRNEGLASVGIYVLYLTYAVLRSFGIL